MFLAFAIPTTVSYQATIWPERVVLSVVASVTKYGPTGNPMANGEMPHVGAVAVSDRTIPIGTIIKVEDKEYIVKDRTAKWIHEKHGLTIDIYSNETNNEMMEFGRKKLTVDFIEK